MPLIDLDAIDKEIIPKDAVSEKLIKKHQAIPLYKRGNRLYIAIAEPTNLLAIDEIKFQTGMSTEAVLVEADKLTVFIETALQSKEDSMADMLGDDMDDVDFEDTEADLAEDEAATSEADDTPVVRFVNKVLLDAIKKAPRISTSNPMKNATVCACE